MRQSLTTRLAALVTLTSMLLSPLGAQSPASSTSGDQSGFRIKVSSEPVLVNVVVRDRDGKVVRGLTKDDFQVSEDNKAQTIASFDLQDVDVATAQAPAAEAPSQAMVLTAPKPPGAAAPPPPPNAGGLRDHRLVVLFFDLSGMEPEEID